jgi:hypothetical protein
MVMAVVITDKVIVQRLTDYIYTGRQMDGDDSHAMRIAKVLYGIGRCIDELFKYHHHSRNLIQNTHSFSLLSHHITMS